MADRQTARKHTFQKRIPANRTAHILAQLLLRHPLQLLNILIADALHFRRRMLRALHQTLHQSAKQLIAAIRGLDVPVTTAHHFVGVGEVAEGGADVAGHGEGVGVLGLAGAGGVDVVESGEEGGEIWSSAGLLVLGLRLDAVFHWGFIRGCEGWIDALWQCLPS